MFYVDNCEKVIQLNDDEVLTMLHAIQLSLQSLKDLAYNSSAPLYLINEYKNLSDVYNKLYRHVKRVVF